MDPKVRSTYLYMMHKGIMGFKSEDLELIREYSIRKTTHLGECAKWNPGLNQFIF